MIAEQDDDYRAYYSDEELAETPAQRRERLKNRFMSKAVDNAVMAKPELPKGTCPKCMKHIGRGVHFHTRSCKG